MRVALPGAFVLAVAYLVAVLVGARFDWISLAGLWTLALLALSATGLLLASFARPARAARLRRDALLAPCVLAPLAVLSPWVLAPSHLGVALGGFPFFLSWLDRYPTVLGVNHEVLLGIGAVLGCAAMPALFAVASVRARHLRARTVLIFLAMTLVAYVPVLVNLDAGILGCAVFLGSGPDPSAAPLAASMAAGPLLHLLSVASMIAFVGVSLRARGAAPPVWET